MALNLTTSTGATVTTLNLSKVQPGQRINFTKEAPELKNIIVKMMWSSHEGGKDVDLDLSAVLLGGNGKAVHGNLDSNSNGDMPRALIYYNNEKGSNGVKHSGDIQSGGTEEMVVTESEIDSDVTDVVVVASSHSEGAAAITFGMAKDPTMLIINGDTNEALYEIDLKDEGSTSTAVEICRFTRKNGNFTMESLNLAVGDTPVGLESIGNRYF